MAERLVWVRVAGAGHHTGYAGPVPVVRVERSGGGRRGVSWTVVPLLPGVQVPEQWRHHRGNELTAAKTAGERVVTAFLALIGAQWKDYSTPYMGPTETEQAA